MFSKARLLSAVSLAVGFALGLTLNTGCGERATFDESMLPGGGDATGGPGGGANGGAPGGQPGGDPAGPGSNMDMDPVGNAGKDDEAVGAPQFPGAPASEVGEPLQPGIGPETSRVCGPGGAAIPVPGPTQVQSVCFFGDEDPTQPAALIEQVIESIDNVEYVHIRLTFSPYFVDNTYGDNAVGWENSKKGEHTFKDLVGSDHAEIILTDGEGDIAMQFVVDYISEDPTSPSGYGTLGVLGGKNDGSMIQGDAEHILAVATSMDRNFNGCGYDMYTENSPITNESFSPDPAAPEWDFRMVYEVWVAVEAFGSAGFGEALIESVHASPSKGADNTIEVIPGPCPEEDCLNLDGICEDPDPGPTPEEPEPEDPDNDPEPEEPDDDPDMDPEPEEPDPDPVEPPI